MTVPVGEISDELQQLIRVTEECLDLGIEQCRVNNRVGDIGWAVQQHAEKYGYGIVRDYTGHGIGRAMHEAPQIPNYGRPGTKKRSGPAIVLRSSRCSTSEPTKREPWTTNGPSSRSTASLPHTPSIRLRYAGRARNFDADKGAKAATEKP